MAQPFLLNKFKVGPSPRNTPSPSITDSVPPPPLNRAIQVGVAIASWAMVVTPLFASVSLQQTVTPPPVTQRVVQATVHQSWADPRLEWPTQYTKKTAIPDRHDVAAFGRESPRPISLWPQPEWDTQQTRKAPIPTRADLPPVRVLQTTAIDRWNEITIVPLLSRVGLQDGPPPSSPLVPLNRVASAPIPLWPQADWDSQRTRRTPIPDRHDAAASSDASTQPIAQWEPTTWTLPPRRTVPIPPLVLPGDQPPPRVLNAFILDRWNEIGLAPIWKPLGMQDGPALSNAPPVVSRQSLLTILSTSWEPPAPLQQRETVVLPSGPPPQADNPPPRQPRLEYLSSQWDVPTLQPVWGSRLIDLSVFFVPTNRALLYKIVSSWVPLDYPQPRLPVVTASGPPPPPFVPYVRDRIAVDLSWVSTWYEQPKRVLFVNPAQTDTPPFNSRHPNLDIIAMAWIPPDPAFQESKPFINPAQIDLPPFGQRLWMTPLLTLWEPLPPQPIVRLPVVTPSGPDPIPPPTINYQDAGDGPKKKKHKTRRTQDELFAELEQTIRDTMAGAPSSVKTREVSSAVVPSVLPQQRMDHLQRMAEDRRDLQQRVAKLQRELDDYLLAQDEDDWMMM